MVKTNNYLQKCDTQENPMELITYLVKNRKAYITLNRPEKRNALSAELVTALKEAFDTAAADEKAKVIILKAEGKAFCAGADLAYLQELQGYSFEENLKDSEHLKELFLKIYMHPKPVIAQVQGHAIAGGCGLATVCDYIYSVEEALFGYTEVKIGFVPAMVLIFLIRKIGESRATQLLLSGELISAEKALTLGMIHHVSSAGRLEEEVNQFAEQLIKNNSAESMKLTKSLIKQVQDVSLEEALRIASQTNAKARATDDCKHGISSFLNKESIIW